MPTNKTPIPNRPRPYAAFFMSLALGGAYAGFFWIAGDSGFLAHARETLVEATGAALIGVPVGFMCSPLIVSWFARKRLVVVAPILLVVVSSSIPVCIRVQPVFGYWSPLGSIGLVVAVFLGSGKVLSMYMPDIVFDPPHCPACGYDLTGNQSGVCTECGLPMPTTTSHAKIELQ